MATNVTARIASQQSPHTKPAPAVVITWPTHPPFAGLVILRFSVKNDIAKSWRLSDE